MVSARSGFRLGKYESLAAHCLDDRVSNQQSLDFSDEAPALADARRSYLGSRASGARSPPAPRHELRPEIADRLSVAPSRS